PPLAIVEPLTQRQRPILVPDHQPVRCRGLVKQGRPEWNRGRADKVIDDRHQSRIVRQLTDGRDSQNAASTSFRPFDHLARQHRQCPKHLRRFKDVRVDGEAVVSAHHRWVALCYPSQLTIHGTPKRSVTIPKRSAQKVFSSGSRTCPPLAIRSNMSSA